LQVARPIGASESQGKWGLIKGESLVTNQGKRVVAVWVPWLGAVILPAALPTASGHCENLRFVFIDDGRGDAPDDQVKVTVLNSINSQILLFSPRPSFVVYGGDIAMITLPRV
jgi:hypothetical protein